MDAYCTVNGQAVLEARIGLPRVGVWSLDAVLDAGSDVSGAVEVKYGSTTLKGTVVRTGKRDDSCRIRVVGGAAGFTKTVPAKSYLNLPMRIPLVDVLTAAGEQLAATADPALLQSFVGRWSRVETIAAFALRSLLEGRDVAWRILPDGTVWIGAESWPVVTLEHELLDEDAITGRVTIYAEDPAVFPGQTFLDRQVSYVEHWFGEVLRTEVRFE
jgi:hypothetical protein